MGISDGDNSGKGTIEFRQPPGVTDALDAIRWIILVGCFARLSCAYTIVPEQKPTLECLGKLIKHEAKACGFSKIYKEELRRMLERADLVQFKAAAVVDANVISGAESVSLRLSNISTRTAGEQKLKDWAKHHSRKTRTAA